MNIKSLLIGSAAALAAVSGAQLTLSSLLSQSPWNTFAFATLSALATSTSQALKLACASVVKFVSPLVSVKTSAAVVAQ
jgi:hypothetical protein